VARPAFGSRPVEVAGPKSAVVARPKSAAVAGSKPDPVQRGTGPRSAAVAAGPKSGPKPAAAARPVWVVVAPSPGPKPRATAAELERTPRVPGEGAAEGRPGPAPRQASERVARRQVLAASRTPALVSPQLVLAPPRPVSVSAPAPRLASGVLAPRPPALASTQLALAPPRQSEVPTSRQLVLALRPMPAPAPRLASEALARPPAPASPEVSETPAWQVALAEGPAPESDPRRAEEMAPTCPISPSAKRSRVVRSSGMCRSIPRRERLDSAGRSSQSPAGQS
jgi:hypothetical protein